MLSTSDSKLLDFQYSITRIAFSQRPGLPGELEFKLSLDFDGEVKVSGDVLDVIFIHRFPLIKVSEARVLDARLWNHYFLP
jgi:hypothetical protein